MNDKDIEGMLLTLNKIATAYDSSEYGLPTGDVGCLAQMREAVKESLKPMTRLAELQQMIESWVVKVEDGKTKPEAAIAAIGILIDTYHSTKFK